MFSWLKKLLKKIISFIKKYWWIIVLVVLAVWLFPAFGATFSSLWAKVWPAVKAGAGSLWSWAKDLGAELGPMKTLALGLGVVSAVSPSTAQNLVENVGKVATSVVDTGVSVAAGGISTLLKNPIVLGGGILALYMLTRR